MRYFAIAFLCLGVLAAPSEASLFHKKTRAKYGVSRGQQMKNAQKARARQVKNRQKLQSHQDRKAVAVRPKSSL